MVRHEREERRLSLDVAEPFQGNNVERVGQGSGVRSHRANRRVLTNYEGTLTKKLSGPYLSHSLVGQTNDAFGPGREAGG